MTSPTITALARTTLLTATLGLLSLSQVKAQSLIIEPGSTTVAPAVSFSLTVTGKDFDTAIVGGGFEQVGLVSHLCLVKGCSFFTKVTSCESQ